MQQREENFDALRRALKLKRHEQPPPGYFSNFSRQVIGRIRENDFYDRRRAMDEAAWEAPWIGRVLGFFQSRPAYAGVVGAAACALMLAAIIFSETPARTATAGGSGLGDPQDMATTPLNTGIESSVAGTTIGPMGALPPGTTLFDKVRPLHAPPVFTSTNLLPK